MEDHNTQKYMKNPKFLALPAGRRNSEHGTRSCGLGTLNMDLGTKRIPYFWLKTNGQ
jgi:hypothetical protein